MSRVVPAIYSPRFRSPYVPLVGRLLAAGVAVACLTVLVVAASLRPSPEGTGTHTGMGFQPCQFLYVTGVPCPACGMTTSFAHYARGHILASLWVQPMGTVLATACAVGIWAGGYIAITGRAAHRVLRFLPGLTVLWVALGFAVIAWGWKVFLVRSGMDGWGG